MLSIIVPTLNEEKGIVKTLKQINKLDIEKEVLVVDGLSKDKTIENAKKYGARVIIEKRKGKGIAMDTGVRNAKGKFICFLDGDGTYPARYIPKMMDIINNCDVVVASRLLKKEGANTSINTFLHYRLFPFIFTNYYKKFKTTEPITGMRLLRKKTWFDLKLKAHDFLIETEMEVKMAKKRMKVAEIPIPCVRRVGKSKWDMSWGTMWKIRNYIKKNQNCLQGLTVVRYPNI